MFRVSTAFYSLTRKGNKYAIFLILIYQIFATNSNFFNPYLCYLMVKNLDLELNRIHSSEYQRSTA